jgi:hypothetical protein
MPDPTQGAAPSGGRSGLRGIGRTPMPLSQLAFYNPNRPDATEAIWQPFYDFQAYGTAGATSMTFFQVPNGQSSKTYADTNMELAGQFPAPTAFLCTAIMVAFFPGGNPSATGTALAASTYWNDVVSVANSGYLELTIGSKPYLRDAPIGKFAPNFTVGGVAAVGIANTALTQTQTAFARAAGRYYEITPFLIPQSQNFNIKLYWPTAQTVNVTGRIGVIMDGFYYRQSQ